MNPHRYTKATTKAELLKLNAALATDNTALRNKVDDLRLELAEAHANQLTNNLKTLFGKPSLATRAKELAKQLNTSTRVRNNEIEVFMHGDWNSLDTINTKELA